MIGWGEVILNTHVCKKIIKYFRTKEFDKLLCITHPTNNMDCFGEVSFSLHSLVSFIMDLWMHVGFLIEFLGQYTLELQSLENLQNSAPSTVEGKYKMCWLRWLNSSLISWTSFHWFLCSCHSMGTCISQYSSLISFVDDWFPCVFLHFFQWLCVFYDVLSFYIWMRWLWMNLKISRTSRIKSSGGTIFSRLMIMSKMAYVAKARRELGPTTIAKVKEVS